MVGRERRITDDRRVAQARDEDTTCVSVSPSGGTSRRLRPILLRDAKGMCMWCVCLRASTVKNEIRLGTHANGWVWRMRLSSSGPKIWSAQPTHGPHGPWVGY
jgi:hypothetical protein